MTTTERPQGQPSRRIEREPITELHADTDIRRAALVATCAACHVEEDALLSHNRERQLADARKIFCYLTRTVAGVPLNRVAAMLGRTHASVYYAAETAAEQMQLSYEFRDKAESAIELFTHLLNRGHEL
ncbi:MAG: hypothetical protein LIO91_10405 [Bacteroidales bacterium]|nr:hypothetical protein [Bacteroidales bacterium]